MIISSFLEWGPCEDAEGKEYPDASRSIVYSYYDIDTESGRPLLVPRAWSITAHTLMCDNGGIESIGRDHLASHNRTS